LAGYAVYLEWVRKKQQQTYYGYVIIVAIDSDEIWISLMQMGSKTGCHQMNDRSFSFKGFQFPICARCTGLLLGQITGFILSFFFLKCDIRLLLCLAVFSTLFLGVDGIGQLKKLWLSTNIRRLITGVLCGHFVTVFIIKLIITLVIWGLGGRD
jgi:uncharacterized membrane protein